MLGKHQKRREITAVVTSLTACAKQKDLYKGTRVHAAICDRGLLEKDIFVGNSLVNLYAKCGALAKAQEVFDKISLRNVVTWNSLITGYAQQGRGMEALKCYEGMQHEGIPPDSITFVCALKACGSLGAAGKGKEIHAEICRQGLENDPLVGTALVVMHAKCGALEKAQEALNNLSVRSVVTWTALIAGYAKQGHGKEALSCFEQMQREGLRPNEVTFVCILKACGSIGAAEKGKEIHGQIVRAGLLKKNVLLGTALVDMYAKCGEVERAQNSFDELLVRNVVSWNTLIVGYAHHGYGEAALDCFVRMQREGFSADVFTFVCILKACGSIGATDKGKAIHAKVVREGLLEKYIIIGTALVDMYAKCGALDKAQEVFDELRVQDRVCWTALIAGYAHDGHGEKAVNCFERMQRDGVSPDTVTFTIVLSACSHAGLVEKGKKYFETLSTGYGIEPTLELYSCMVDLFGRAGHFNEVIAVIQKMPTSDFFPMWIALLSACERWGNMKLGSQAFERVVQLDENYAAAYVCMSKIYAAAAMQEDKDKLESMRVEIKHGRS